MRQTKRMTTSFRFSEQASGLGRMLKRGCKVKYGQLEGIL